MAVPPTPRPRPEPHVRGYEVSITKGTILYQIEIHHGLSSSDAPYVALTLEGAKRRARRLVARDRRRHQRHNTIIAKWTVPPADTR